MAGLSAEESSGLGLSQLKGMSSPSVGGLDIVDT